MIVLLALVACDASNIDPSDVQDVFDSAKPLAKTAAPKASSNESEPEPKIAPLERKPVAGPCIAQAGEPANLNRRPAGRPGCRRARVMERRDEDGTPRYGCVFKDRRATDRKPLPLVVFLHSEIDDPRAVHRKTRFQRRYSKLDLTGDPKHPGFVVLAPQARRILTGKQKRSLSARWDTAHHTPHNADIVAIDGFVQTLIDEGLVDARQIYAIGESRGGDMALLYAMLRPDRIAAVGIYGAVPNDLRWTCEADQPPVAVLYRSCDTITPCADVEQWLGRREDERAPTWSMRLGAAKATQPSCVLTKRRCREKKGTANHQRWPKPREGEMLEYLSRYSLALER